MSGFDMEILADNLRAERVRARMSQKDVADAIGASPAAVQKWEAGESVPLIGSVYSLADLYGIGIDKLCGWNKAEQSAA